MSEHVLKIHEQPFNDLMSGAKTAEVRNNDRGFQVGDIVRLREIYDGSEAFTGRETRRLITHVQTDYGLPDNRCVLSYAPDIDARKAGQGEAVYVVPVTGSLDEIDAPVWPFINAEAQKVGAEHGRIETYKYERANGGVAVLWDANRIHAMAVTIRDDMNRTRCIRMLTAPPASADAVSVPMELLERTISNLLYGSARDNAEELRAMLARQEVKS